ncbi:hypothetical protein B0G38_000835 [Arthrobacter sp. VKM Ac-2550]|nr:hypothetical protein [Arthrobacter sp. VKM Ac-2550]
MINPEFRNAVQTLVKIKLSDAGNLVMAFVHAGVSRAALRGPRGHREVTRSGYTTAMLTGDNTITANGLGKEAGITEVQGTPK